MSRPSEDEIIARYLAPLAGPGGLGLRDDAALATPRAGHDLVVSTDMLVAGVHFFADDPAGAIARKALRVNLSDLAAKAARPTGVLLGLALPHDWTEPWLAEFCAGLADDLRAFDCALLGGDTVGTPGPLTISITAFGEVASGRMVPRTGARAGDALFVSGTIGDAALGLRVRIAAPEDADWIAALDAADRAHLLDRYLLPRPRLALRPALAHARAAMDVSDGFVGDLAKMLALEGLSTTLAAARVPLSPAAAAASRGRPGVLAAALTGGDDYEILCAVAPDRVAAFEAEAAKLDFGVTRLGTARSGSGGVVVEDDGGRGIALASQRHEHFS
ncbi:Thiamine-monophosphate kinase [Beijerinckiaceae bacterium RH AL1]|nr:Thiamine-monophosphate kinase [Beijerinckiaceae bacterium RH CH11]VVB45068.1 Thiamine-monophosphate kinase [Beijerinckiaceae bacterium RH AL8]VVC54639.1 Thiamine-monophosphate kinase [Beijerinckiaceae bacterium RH AL1]